MENAIFNHALLIGIFRCSYNAFRRMPWNLIDVKSALVQVMAWCHQATSHSNVDQVLCCHMASLGYNEIIYQDWNKMVHIFKCFFLNENHCILIQISLKFVPKDLLNNKVALVSGMAWCRTGTKPFPEPMLTKSECHMALFVVVSVKWQNKSYLIFFIFTCDILHVLVAHAIRSLARV